MNIWRNIRKNLFQLTQGEFAFMVGVTQSTVSRWERGESFPSYPELVQMRAYAKETGVMWNDVLFFEPFLEDKAA